MTPVAHWSAIEALRLARARVGDVVASFRATGQRYLIVVEADAGGAVAIRGVFSANRVEPLGHAIEEELRSATFSALAQLARRWLGQWLRPMRHACRLRPDVQLVDEGEYARGLTSDPLTPHVRIQQTRRPSTATARRSRLRIRAGWCCCCWALPPAPAG